MRNIIRSRPAQAALVGFGVIAAAVTAGSAAAAISSNVYIDARETFVLGGNQPGDFTVRGQNKGDVIVEVYVSEGGSAHFGCHHRAGRPFQRGLCAGRGGLAAQHLHRCSGTCEGARHRHHSQPRNGLRGLVMQGGRGGSTWGGGVSLFLVVFGLPS